jgi:hypothetical protein
MSKKQPYKCSVPRRDEIEKITSLRTTFYASKIDLNVRVGSTLRVLPTSLLQQKSLRFLPELPKGRNSPSVPILTVAANIPDKQLGARYLPVKSTRGF